ncbi:L-lysine exporter [Microbacterium sp. M28]|uniref:L-lysine exporter n=1 Tax=Microbacterium sp. M28 TaxID=2962064 RepID=UPI0021F4EF75|nr:L-lysine exporter [Microbacterium sp. M28]UYO97840.1 L-lysine exporter [Microbacterium sp. M28]
MISILAGLGLGLSLIVAIGAQNVFVLRQGIRREHVLAVVVICAASDAVLIAAGVAGLGFLVEGAPWLLTVARWLGATFLLGYGMLAARRAWRGTGATLDPAQEDTIESETRPSEQLVGTGPSRVATADVTTRTRSVVPVILTALALTWLNPHVYLDTVLMLGSIAATYGDSRWLFAAGAITASCLWFTALGFGARYLGRWLRTPRAWRILDAVIAVVMVAIAIGLILPALPS